MEVELDFDSYYDNLKIRHQENILKEVNAIINSYDPFGIAKEEVDEYYLEAKFILDLFPKVNTESEMIFEVRQIFRRMFFDGPQTSIEKMTPIGQKLYELKLNVDKFNSGRE